MLNSSRIRWLFLVLPLVLIGLAGALNMDFIGYVQSWIGVVFKFVSGCLVGWAIARFVLRIDLSALAAADRPLPGLAVAVLIAAGGIAVATGT